MNALDLVQLFDANLKGQQSFTVAALSVVCRAVADPTVKMTGPRVSEALACSKQSAYSHLQRLAAMGLVVDGYATEKAVAMFAGDGGQVVASWHDGHATYTTTRHPDEAPAPTVEASLPVQPAAPATVVPMQRPEAPAVPSNSPHGTYAADEDHYARDGMYCGDDHPAELLWWIDGVERYVVMRKDWPALEAGQVSAASIEDRLRDDGRID